MQKSFKRIVFIIIWILAGIELGITSPTQAQGAYKVKINYPEISEGQNKVWMGLYFSIVDSDDQIIPDPQVESAEFVLGNGNVAMAIPGKPNSQAYIALVLDTSGSMIEAMPQMRQAAIQAVQSAPPEAAFTVFQFNTVITEVQDFTNDREQLAEKINTINAVLGSGTCLYDAVFHSVQIIQGAPSGRRAVVLLTDGKDELTEGQPCSQHTFSDVIALATLQDARVPINTIGLSTGSSSALNEAQLEEMATITGGIAELAKQSSLALVFTKIINSLSYQWLAQADIYPSMGENTLSLKVTLADGTILESEKPITFTSKQDYIAPPSAMVKTVAFTRYGDVIVNLYLQNESLIENFEIQILDIKNKVLTPAFTAEVTENLEISALNFKDGNEYLLYIRGLDSTGKALFTSEYNFHYNPSIPLGELSILTVELNKDTPEFIINLQSKNLEEASGFEVWLIDKKSNTVVPGSKQAIELSSTIHFPLGGIRNGTYSFVVTAINPESEILAETSYEAIYKLGILDAIKQSLRNSFFLQAFIFLIFAASCGYLVKKFYMDPKKTKPAPILLEETVMKGDQALDDWSEDALRLNKERQREDIRRHRRTNPEKAQAAIADEAQKMPDTVQDSPELEEINLPEEPPNIEPPISRPVVPALVVERSPEGLFDGQEYAIKDLPFIIGRSEANLELDLPFISRKQVEIFSVDGEIFIRDEDSTNKTFLDGEMITGKGDFPLKSGASVGLGKQFILKFIMKDDQRGDDVIL